jgi:hypothetical protein
MPPLVTGPLAPGDRREALAWTERMVPTHSTAIRFRFQFQDKKRKVSGRGTARVAPPDSLRFDYVGPLGMGAGAAVVVGDSTVWADPEASFRSLAPGIPMLWAALGIVRPPEPDAQVETGGAAPRTIWRFVNGADTLDYVATDGVPRVLEGQWRREGRVLARSHTEFDGRAFPTLAHVDFPETRARFELTVVAVDTTATIAPALWRSRR